MMTENNSIDDSMVEVRCYFVRHKNALAVRANFSQIYMDHYIHLLENQIKTDQLNDQNLKDALAGCALHLASRPWDEVSAWTIHFSNPLINIFVTGNSNERNLIGRIFTEGIKDDQKNLFIAQINNFPKEPRRSVIEFDPENSIFKIIENYYLQSEQRLGRFFKYSEEEFVFISAQPDCDEEWLTSLSDSDIKKLDSDEELSLLEKRFYRYHCGCSKERILRALRSATREEVFGDKESISIECPRCAKDIPLNIKEFDEMKIDT